ncbi:hypothetical protein [Microbacterium sp. KSW4-4]|uniref:hypothetical protein n=1 Tax=Microbacterium sp. KSW4-4 TaxID=2851651 RepID=UPI001FFDC890|nr:hypothetical protein [Microbacterium sp. KSW4-4]MCK2034473.1 hypothetical protein [Microbacterium sp. KSW4-4]
MIDTRDEMTWPEEHVAWQGIIDAAPEMSVPHAVHVFIFHTAKQLQSAVGQENIGGHSQAWNAPDSRGVAAVIMLNAEELYLSIVAHEASHVALYHHSGLEQTRVGARRWLKDHPESIAEMIGNLTALIWYGIPDLGSEQ